MRFLPPLTSAVHELRPVRSTVRHEPDPGWESRHHPIGATWSRPGSCPAACGGAKMASGTSDARHGPANAFSRTGLRNQNQGPPGERRGRIARQCGVATTTGCHLCRRAPSSSFPPGRRGSGRKLRVVVHEETWSRDLPWMTSLWLSGVDSGPDSDLLERRDAWQSSEVHGGWRWYCVGRGGRRCISGLWTVAPIREAAPQPLGPSPVGVKLGKKDVLDTVVQGSCT